MARDKLSLASVNHRGQNTPGIITRYVAREKCPVVAREPRLGRSRNGMECMYQFENQPCHSCALVSTALFVVSQTSMIASTRRTFRPSPTSTLSHQPYPSVLCCLFVPEFIHRLLDGMRMRRKCPCAPPDNEHSSPFATNGDDTAWAESIHNWAKTSQPWVRHHREMAGAPSRAGFRAMTAQ